MIDVRFAQYPYAARLDQELQILVATYSTLNYKLDTFRLNMMIVKYSAIYHYCHTSYINLRTTVVLCMSTAAFPMLLLR